MADDPGDKTRQLRRLIEDRLRQTDPTSGFSLHNWLMGVQQEATRLGIWDRVLAVEIWHEYVRQGIVAVTGNLGVWMGERPPECIVTRWGRDALKRSGPSPHDPEGYVRDSMIAFARSDPVVERLLSESVGAFNGGHYLASAALLGFACERVVRRLAVDVHRALPDSPEKSRFYDKAIKVGEGKRGMRQPRIGDVMDQVQGVVERGTLGLSEKVRIEARSMLEGIFEIVTKLRDSAAHDEDPLATKGEVEARLLLLPHWLRHVREIQNVLASRSPNP